MGVGGDVMIGVSSIGGGVYGAVLTGGIGGAGGGCIGVGGT